MIARPDWPQVEAEDFTSVISITSSKTKGGGDGIGCTKVAKCVNIMIMTDARSIPIAVNTGSTIPYESPPSRTSLRLDGVSERLIGNKAYDSDNLDADLAAKGVEMISPHRAIASRITLRKTAAIQTPLDRRENHQLASKLPVVAHSRGKIHSDVPRRHSFYMLAITN